MRARPPASCGSRTRPSPAARSTSNTSVTADRPTNDSQKTLDATRQARSRSPRCSRSLKTGTNAAPSAESATSARTRFGTWNATVNALIDPCTPKNAAATISRSTPDDPAETGRDREQRGRDRQATSRGGLERRGGVGLGHRARIGTRPAGPGSRRAASALTVLDSGVAPAVRGRLVRSDQHSRGIVANIKQQKKRVKVSARERLENLRYRTAIKTYFRRLGVAVDSGDAETVASEHRALVRLIDRAGAKRALHPNTAARKKSNAAAARHRRPPRAGQQAARHAQGSIGDGAARRTPRSRRRAPRRRSELPLGAITRRQPVRPRGRPTLPGWLSARQRPGARHANACWALPCSSP